MSSIKATVIAFLVAPVVPAVVLAAYSVGRSEWQLGPLVGFALVFYWPALVAALCIGGPALWLLQRFNLVTWWSATATGAIVGPLALYLITSSGADLSDALPLYSTLGSVAGLAFWLVWRHGQGPVPPQASLHDA
jgi:hypothetical protein